MNLEIKIGMFILFIILYFVFLGISYYFVLKAVKSAIAKRSYFYTNALNFASSYAALFGFIWILSGFVDLRFAALLVATQLVSIVLGVIGYSLVKRKDINWSAHLTWEGFLFGIRYSVLQKVIGFVSAAILIAFPIWAGWVYFRNPLWSEAVVAKIFVGTTSYFVLLSVFMLLPQVIAMLTSSTLDENARDRVLIVQLGGFITNGLLIAMIISVFRIEAAGGPISAIPLGLSGIVVSILVIFLLIAYVLPYMVGVQRAKRTRAQLGGEMQELLQGAVDEFKAPRAPAARLDFIAELQSQIHRQIDELRQAGPQIDLAEAIEGARESSAVRQTMPKPFQETLPLLTQVYDQVEPFDPYVSQWKQLKKLDSDLSELSKILNDPGQVFVPDPISRQVSVFESRLTRPDAERASSEGWGMSVVITSLLSALATPFLEKAGKLIVEPIAEAAGIKLGILDFLISRLS